MTTHEPIDAAGAEELRRAAAECDASGAPGVPAEYARAAAAGLVDALVRHRYAILASLELLAKGVEGTTEHAVEHGPGNVVSRLYTDRPVARRVLVIPLPEEPADGR